MKRKQGDCDCEETVKRLTSAGTLLPDKHLCQPQQVRAVEFQTAGETSPLLEVPPGVSAVETVTVSTSVAVTGARDSCILGRTVPYTLPGSHTSALVLSQFHRCQHLNQLESRQILMKQFKNH
ncbi:uncharacterized protein LOC135101493 [Scylla paramamosain]|uniref:uncharacterized protein LOC135101493 n=1 Tax=Scylla paramamosain TaxID=85552 RepID=UPI003082A440